MSYLDVHVSIQVFVYYNYCDVLDMNKQEPKKLLLVHCLLCRKALVHNHESSVVLEISDSYLVS